jgi:hypothetical protein
VLKQRAGAPSLCAPDQLAAAVVEEFVCCGTSETIGSGRALTRVAPKVCGQSARGRAHPEDCEAVGNRIVNPGTRLENPTAEHRIRGTTDNRVRDLLVVQHSPAATGPAHHIDAIARACLEVDVVHGLHSPEAQTGRREAVQPHGANDLSMDAGVKQCKVATHVGLTWRGLVDEQRESLSVRGGRHLRH